MNLTGGMSAAGERALGPVFRPAQVVLALALVVLGALLLLSSLVALREDRRAVDRLRDNESAATSAVFIQRETLRLASTAEKWLLGVMPRREVQVQRSLLARRMAVVTTDGRTGNQIVGPRFRDALRRFDDLLATTTPGLLAAEARAAEEARFRPAVRALERAAVNVSDDLQRLEGDALEGSESSRLALQARIVALFGLGLVVGLTLAIWSMLRVRSTYRAARARLAADEAALARAAALDRGKTHILSGTVQGRPVGELLEEVLDLAEELTGCAFRMVVADDVGVAASGRVTSGASFPSADVPAEAGAVPTRWPIAVDGGRRLGDLRLVGPVERAAAADPAETADLDEVGGWTSNLAALVLDRHMAAERLRHRAAHDALTGMPNRHHFLDRLRRAMAERSAGRSGPPAVVFCDLDRFKLVNDSLGHREGDRLLRAVAERLEACGNGTTVTFARLGGDEFVALCVGPDAPETARAVADDVARVLAEPFRLGSSEVFVSASMGIAVAGPDDDVAEQVLRNADVAMYRAKHGRRTQVVAYDAELEADVSEQLATDAALRRVLASEGLVVHLQPIIDLEARAVTGVEALVRWERDGVLVPPAEFLPLAARNGLLSEIDRQVMERSLSELAAHRAAGGPPVDVWINMALDQLRDPGLVPWMLERLEAHGLSAGQLVVELSEGDLLDLDDVGDTLAAMRAAGVRVAMDDFGTGYSSLVQLGALPVDVVKLDRAFVSALAEGGDSARNILGAAVAMVDAVGLDMVVEGVETDEELQAVRHLGCRHAQGYLLGRPAVAGEVLARLRDGVGATGITAVTAVTTATDAVPAGIVHVSGPAPMPTPTPTSTS